MTSTATKNVSILDDSFLFPSLGRQRRIWVYRPGDYENSNERYPVIYMHDGQNLFDELNAFGTEWGIDETLDAEQGKVIIIGIDNGAEHRMTEYMFHDHPDHGAGEGASYLKDLAEILKPYVDSKLRTKPEKEFTCIAGSSMGGLISFYAGLYLPHVFFSIGVFSPALWIDAPAIFREAQEILSRRPGLAGNGVPQCWYFYAGALESETMLSEVAAMVKIIRDCPHTDVTYQLDAAGVHDESVWKHYFPNLYKWFTNQKSAPDLEKESQIKIP